MLACYICKEKYYAYLYVPFESNYILISCLTMFYLVYTKPVY